MKSSITKLAAIAASLTCASLAYSATGGDHFLALNLGAGSTYDVWTDLSTTGVGFATGFPGSAAWPNGVASQGSSTGTAELLKVSNGTGGGPYPASGSIYFGGFSGDVNNEGGTLAVTSTAIDDLSNVVFQIEIGEAWTYDFFNHELPALIYYVQGDSTAYTLTASYSAVIYQQYNGTVTMPSGEESLYNNTYLLQWDFSDIENVESFNISFTGVQHSQLYALQLDQGTVFSAIPEPSTWAAVLGFIVLTSTIVRRRWNR